MGADTPYDKLRHFLPDTDDVGLDGYEVLHPIAEGGFGRVYLARQVAFDRNVAIKVLGSVGFERDTADRFERECRAVGALSAHPNIVTIYDSGITPWGRPYIVMEHMAGGSVARRIAAEGALGPEAAVDLIVKIAGAVAVAHRSGIVHRDIKPENVLISSYGEPVLGDFGVASIPGGYHTHTGAITATLAHAAPEVMDGAEAGPASDIYSLGSTLFTLIAGHAPFESPERPGLQALIARTMMQPVPDLRTTGVPDEICAVIEKALAKDASERFSSAEDLVAALQQAQESLGLPVTEVVGQGFVVDAPVLFPSQSDEAKTVVRTRKPTPPPPASPPRRRRTWKSPALAAVLLVAITVTAGGTLATNFRRPAASAAKQPTGVAATESPAPPIASDELDEPRAPSRNARDEKKRPQRRSAKDAGTLAFGAAGGGAFGGADAATTHDPQQSATTSGGYRPAGGSADTASGGGGGSAGDGGGSGGSQSSEPAAPAPPPPADTLLYHLYSDDGSYYFTTSTSEMNEKTFSYDHSHREAAVWETGTQKMRRICYGDGRCGGWVFIQKPAGIRTRPLYAFTGPYGDYYTTDKSEIPPQYADRHIYLFGYVQ